MLFLIFISLYYILFITQVCRNNYIYIDETFMINFNFNETSNTNDFYKIFLLFIFKKKERNFLK